jgi:negative regulator of sigma-B (phosphoserine phosphatase)
MTAADLRNPGPLVAWGCSSRALRTTEPSGDLHVVAPFPSGTVVAALDGLGHGAEAAAAAEAGADIIQRHAGEPVIQIIQRCHEGLRRTRGVVLAIASFDASENSLTWVGVGNIDASLFRADDRRGDARVSLIMRGGVVGYQLPPLRVATLPLARGDTLIMATDGIRGEFTSESPLGRDPQAYADDMLRRYGKDTDDALSLAVRYLGLAP